MATRVNECHCAVAKPGSTTQPPKTSSPPSQHRSDGHLQRDQARIRLAPPGRCERDIPLRLSALPVPDTLRIVESLAKKDISRLLRPIAEFPPPPPERLACFDQCLIRKRFLEATGY